VKKKGIRQDGDDRVESLIEDPVIIGEGQLVKCHEGLVPSGRPDENSQKERKHGGRDGCPF